MTTEKALFWLCVLVISGFTSIFAGRRANLVSGDSVFFHLCVASGALILALLSLIPVGFWMLKYVLN